MINKYFIKANESIESAIRKISDSGQKCIVVHKNKRLVGTISDGDIRKTIVKNINIKTSINKYFNKNPKYLEEHNYTEQDIKIFFNKYNLDIIPIVDKKNIIKFVIDRNYFFKKKLSRNHKLKVPVVIMAGGRGTRLKPITDVIPKPLVPYKGVPIVEQIFNDFFGQGFKEFNLTLNFKSKIIETYIKEIKKNNMTINMVKEIVPRGTASSLKLFKNKIKGDFIVTNCDVLFNLDYENLIRFHKENKNIITVVGAIKNIKIPYGVCKILKRNILQRIEEKPDYELIVSTGLYVVNEKVMKIIPKSKEYNFDKLISDVINKKHKISVYKIDDKSWIDVGHWDGFKKNINF